MSELNHWFPSIKISLHLRKEKTKMLGSEVSRLFKGTYFTKNELTVVSLEAETNQFRLLQSMTTFLETSLSEKKSVQVLDLSEQIEAFVEATESEKELSKQVEKLKDMLKNVGGDFLILKHADLFFELLEKPQKMLLHLLKICSQITPLSKQYSE